MAAAAVLALAVSGLWLVMRPMASAASVTDKKHLMRPLKVSRSAPMSRPPA